MDRTPNPLFLTGVEEFLAAAPACLAQGHLQAAAANAIHMAVAATDVESVLPAGERSASEQHEDAVDLLTALGLPDAAREPR